MTEMEIIKSIWLGKKYISIGDTKIAGEEVHFKKMGGLPFMNPFVPVLANASDVPFQERNIWIPSLGDTGMKLRIYMADLRLDKYYAITNTQDIEAIKSLRKENEALRMTLERLWKMVYDESGEDRKLKSIKKDIDKYNLIKGYGGYNSSYGGGGGGFFGGGTSMGGNPDEPTNL